ncbi:MAG TPA: IS200/IS605 family transposase [Pyrinomonadaceae bacterium]|nr:IS200/IS605 family transposase [Pyrinomonadaceae bacterium]
MSSTHLSLHYHLIFSTKNRRPLIANDWRGRLHAFLGGAVRNTGGIPEAIGGMDDHVHLLVGLRANHTLADILRDIKSASSHWAHETMGERDFAWQDGYGAFTVSASQIGRVKSYIAQQERHHRKLSFQDEYVEFLKQSGVEYDERFL